MTQQIIVYLILAFSILYIAWLVRKKIITKKPESCHDCEGCSLKKGNNCR